MCHGRDTQLPFDKDEDMAACVQTAKQLMSAQQDWDGRVRAYAARELSSLANDWAQDGAQEGEDSQEVTQEQFVERMELESVQVGAGGDLEFWFGDGDLFWGHAIHVSATLAQGPTAAKMEE